MNRERQASSSQPRANGQASPTRIVVADDLPESALALLRAEPGWVVDARSGRSAADLARDLADADGLLVRSATKVTSDLLAAAPRPDPENRRVHPAHLNDDVPSPLNKPSGCAFRTRCPIARPSCADEVPPLAMRAGREVACPYSE